MMRDWQDGDPWGPEQEATAKRSLAEGWFPHYLARDLELGGGLTIDQLRKLQAKLAGNELPGCKRIDWDQWLSWAESDPTAAANASRFLCTVGDCIATEGRVRWGDHGWRPPHRISPREILRAADLQEPVEWNVDRSLIQQKLSDVVSPRPSHQLAECLAISWSKSMEQAWHCLTLAARRELVRWICRFASGALGAACVTEPVIAIASDRKQVAAVAVDADGACCDERTMTIDATTLPQQLAELSQSHGAQLVIGRIDSLNAIRDALTKTCEAVPGLQWVVIDGCGAHWWSKQLDAVTTHGQWSALGREALFMARTLQSPLETLAEIPAAEFAPVDLHQWMADADWREVEHHVEDVIHERGLNLCRSGPRAVARLCSVSPLHAHRARPPAAGWSSLEQFREALRLNDQQWAQTAPFVRLGVGSHSESPRSIAAVRDRILPWEQLVEGQSCHGTVLRAATFGAFLDIGAPCEAMLHISECSRRFVSDPWECLSPGEVLKVEISRLDQERRRIAVRLAGGKQSSSGKSSRPQRNAAVQRRDQEKKRKGKRSTRGRGATQKTKPPKPQADVKKPAPQPLSQEMADGKAPMRSFSDLVQFYDQKRTEEDSSS